MLGLDKVCNQLTDTQTPHKAIDGAHEAAAHRTALIDSTSKCIIHSTRKTQIHQIQLELIQVL